jgi:hypothetical protein
MNFSSELASTWRRRKLVWTNTPTQTILLRYITRLCALELLAQTRRRVSFADGTRIVATAKDIVDKFAWCREISAIPLVGEWGAPVGNNTSAKRISSSADRPVFGAACCDLAAGKLLGPALCRQAQQSRCGEKCAKDAHCSNSLVSFWSDSLDLRLPNSRVILRLR